MYRLMGVLAYRFKIEIFNTFTICFIFILFFILYTTRKIKKN